MCGASAEVYFVPHWHMRDVQLPIFSLVKVDIAYATLQALDLVASMQPLGTWVHSLHGFIAYNHMPMLR